MAYRAVFFDAGETLLSAHPSFPELLARVLSDEGHAVTADDVRREVNGVSERFLRAARERELWSTSREASRRFWADVYRILLGRLGVEYTEEIADVLYRTFTTLENYRLFPDAEPTLRALRSRGLVVGVISNFEEWLERLLEALGVIAYFGVRVISGVEGVEKPDPRIFELALERAGVPATEAVYVGDNPFFDVEPAASIGIHAILLDRRERHPDHAGPRIASLAELPAIVRAAA